MDRLTPPPHPILQRSVYSAGAYWALNLLLIGVEARWHVLYHLTVWDVRTLCKLIHHG
jgi:hypothetical protein